VQSRLINHRASSIIEYAVLILAVVLAFSAIRVSIRAYIEGSWRSNVAAVVGDGQYN